MIMYGNLVEITGNPKAAMHYARYDEEIVQRYGIELQGWTYEKIIISQLFSSTFENSDGCTHG